MNSISGGTMPLGLPTLRLSNAASSSAFASMASANLFSAAALVAGELAPQLSNALAAALTALSTSALSDEGTSASNSPVAGSITLSTRSVAGFTHLPPTKLPRVMSRPSSARTSARARTVVVMVAPWWT